LSRASDRISEVGKKRLKGFEDPVRLFEVRWREE
jgi:class 3 adenylate cyclase